MQPAHQFRLFAAKLMRGAATAPTSEEKACLVATARHWERMARQLEVPPPQAFFHSAEGKEAAWAFGLVGQKSVPTTSFLNPYSSAGAVLNRRQVW